MFFASNYQWLVQGQRTKELWATSCHYFYFYHCQGMLRLVTKFAGSSAGELGFPRIRPNNKYKYGLRPNNECPRIFDPFYIVTYYMKWAKTSWIFYTE